MTEQEEQLREEFEAAYRERLEAAEARADANFASYERVKASLSAEINRNTPLEARMRKALEEIRSFVCVPRDDNDPMADELNAGSVIRMARIAREALRITENPTSHKAGSNQ